MSWIAQQYEGAVHVVPDTEPGHVLAADCFCNPWPDPDVVMWVHHDRLDREHPEADVRNQDDGTVR